jgi:xanthine dehydrogenase accessory factor
MMIWTHLLQAIEADGAVALVSVVKALGSTPREAGARMIVTPWGSIGTIGGGALEFQAIADARRQLVDGVIGPRSCSQALGPDLGQCCGGRVELMIEAFDERHRDQLQDLATREAAGPFTLTGRIVGPDFIESFGEQRHKLYLFGAGHVGQAVVTALTPLIEAPLAATPLPVEVIWVDERGDCFPSNLPAHVQAVITDDPVALITEAAADSLVLIMTHSHALDYDLTAAALQHPDLSYVGLIGSATKRARFSRRLREAGIAAARLADLACPIGQPAIHSKHPAAIAAATVVELLTRVEQVAARSALDDRIVDAGQHLRSQRQRDINMPETCCGNAKSCTGCAPKAAIASVSDVAAQQSRQRRDRRE